MGAEDPDAALLVSQGDQEEERVPRHGEATGWTRRLAAGVRTARGFLGRRLRSGGRGGAGKPPGHRRKLGPLRAFLVLLGRSLRETGRDHFVNGVRMVATVVLAGLFGLVWGQQHSVVDRIGSVVMTSINTSMIALVRALTNFVEERPIVARERRYYGALPYLLSKIFAEAPLDAFFAGLFGFMVHKSCHMTGHTLNFVLHCVFQALASSAFGQLIGAIVPSPATAMAAGPPLMLVLVIVGAVGPSGRPNLPGWLQPLRDMSMIRYGCEGLCVNELSAPVVDYSLGASAKVRSCLVRPVPPPRLLSTLTFCLAPCSLAPTMRALCLVPWISCARSRLKFPHPHPRAQVLDVTQRKLMLQRLGLETCSVEGALHGQMRLLAGCYAVTLGALIAGAPRPASFSQRDEGPRKGQDQQHDGREVVQEGGA